MGLAVLEAEAVTAAVIGRLASDTAPGGVSTLVGGRIYRDQAPEGSAYPLVVVSWMAATDFLTANGEHVAQDVIVLVKAIDRAASYATLQTIGKRIAERVDGFEDATHDGVFIVKLRRIDMLPQPPINENGKRYLFLNQRFFTEAEPA